MNNLYWHRSINLGDMISPYLLKKLKGDVVYSEPDSDEHKYILTGSILSAPIKNATIFGAGFVSEDETFKGENCIIKAVRGNRTLNKLDNPEGVIVGDPGLLLPYYYNPQPEKKYKAGIVPHIMDYERLYKEDTGHTYNIIDLRMGFNESIEEAIERIIFQVNQCEAILSSSLHGLVIARAYGIPSNYFHSESLIGDGFKFRDFLETDVDIEKLYQSFLTL